MPDTEGNPARPPRFPFVALAHCAACVAAAVWVWVMYSYVVDVTVPDALSHLTAGRRPYVRLHAEVDRIRRPVRLVIPAGRDPLAVCIRAPLPRGLPFIVCLREGAKRPEGVDAQFTGRLCLVDATTGASGPVPAVDTTRSRLTGASVAALVIGAMGIFVFAVALRHWLEERGAWREKTAGA